MKREYSANFYANNGTCFNKDLRGSNKVELLRIVRRTAAAERFAGSTARWYVWHGVKCVAAGYIDDSGFHRFDELYYYDLVESNE